MDEEYFQYTIESNIEALADVQAIETCDGIFIKIATSALKCPMHWTFAQADHVAEAMRYSAKSVSSTEAGV